MKQSVLVFLGGGVGSVTRFWLGSWVQSQSKIAFPIGTLLINVLGSLLIGVAMGQILARDLADDWKFLVVTGLLGGFTTFSAFSYEALSLIQRHHLKEAAGYVLGSILLGLVCCWIGLKLSS